MGGVVPADMPDYTINRVQGQITKVLGHAVEAAVAADQLPPAVRGHEITIEVPREAEHGDYASNIALTLARPARRSPRDIAAIITDHLNTEGTFISDVSVAGPGFINFSLDPAWLHEVVQDIGRAGGNYGQVNYGRGQKVLVEFVSANPTGPLNVVSARHAALGDALANVLAAAGYEARREYYVNDAGNQIQTLGLALDIRLRQLQGEDVELPEGAYPGEYLVDLARRLLAEAGGAGKLDLPQNPAERQKVLARRAVDEFVAEHQEMLRRYGVEFDRWFRETEVRESGGAAAVIDGLQAAGYVYEQADALWFRTTQLGDDKDRVLQKSDGEYTYLVPDVAYHLHKLQRGFDLLIDILGRDHFGYHLRLEAALTGLGYDAARLEVLYLQMVHLVRGQEAVRMSKRQGSYVTMAEFLDEVSIDAARYFFLMRSADTELDFDLDLANLQGNENPVYYVQYAHARLAGILRQAKEQGVAPPALADLDLDALRQEAGSDLWRHTAEQHLLRHLAALPQEIADAARTRSPHHLTRYAHDLATAFHQFYTHCRVLDGQEHMVTARLLLVQATRIVLQRVLGLLGVSAPDRM